jgi:hypothetical protein
MGWSVAARQLGGFRSKVIEKRVESRDAIVDRDWVTSRALRRWPLFMGMASFAGRPLLLPILPLLLLLHLLLLLFLAI